MCTSTIFQYIVSDHSLPLGLKTTDCRKYSQNQSSFFLTSLAVSIGMIKKKEQGFNHFHHRIVYRIVFVTFIVFDWWINALYPDELVKLSIFACSCIHVYIFLKYIPFHCLNSPLFHPILPLLQEHMWYK
jgi:hypothetical protein